MNNSTRVRPSDLCTLWRWSWVPLVSLLAWGCTPRELMCEPVAYYEVLEPERGAGAAPFSIERLGRKVEGVLTRLEYIVLAKDNHMHVGWSAYDFGAEYDMMFSPSEGLARDVKDPELVNPMKRFSGFWSERVRFGFRSNVCLSRDKFGTYAFCPYSEDERFLVADMTCHSVIAEEVVEEQLFNARE